MKTQTLTEEQLPETFPELLQGFIHAEEFEESTLDGIIQNALTKQFPLLDKNALNTKRDLQVDINKLKTTDGGGSKITVKKNVCSCLGNQMGEDKVFKIGPKIPSYMSLKIPLFAYSIDSDWKENGILTHEFPWEVNVKINSKNDTSLRITEQESYGYGSGMYDSEKLVVFADEGSHHDIKMKGKYVYKRDVKIKTKVPVTPEKIKQYIPEAISRYFQAYAGAVQELKLTEPTPACQPQIGVLWVPSVDSLEFTVKNPSPPYRDPALIMSVGEDKYVVGLWDIENERPINSVLREWTSGSFSGASKQKNRK